MSDDIWVLDGSAFVKLIKDEPESLELRTWVAARRCVSSALVRTEARRAVVEENASLRRLCELRLAEADLIDLNSAVLDSAGQIPGRSLRSLDAIYIACALELGDDLGGLVSYDTRQLAAAEDIGITTASPGVPSTS